MNWWVLGIILWVSGVITLVIYDGGDSLSRLFQEMGHLMGIYTRYIDKFLSRRKAPPLPKVVKENFGGVVENPRPNTVVRDVDHIKEIRDVAWILCSCDAMRGWVCAWHRQGGGAQALRSLETILKEQEKLRDNLITLVRFGFLVNVDGKRATSDTIVDPTLRELLKTILRAETIKDAQDAVMKSDV